MVKRCIVEFIGTFFLVLVIALTGNPIAIGVILTALVYMGGYISGAHYNPAVTFALLLNKKITDSDALKYIVTQFIGGFTAAIVFYIITGSKFIPQPGVDTRFAAALLVETLFTFLLASVVLHVAATNKTKGNNYFGLAIGFTVMAIAFAGGPISGGVYNPAVGIGPILFDFANINGYFTSIIIYLLGPFIGGGLAGTVYKYIY